MHAIGYARVSTEGQAVDGVSLDAQRAKIAAWALASDMKIVSMHTDAGLSGGRADNRPALQTALSEACRRKCVLVVYSLSRLSRSIKDTLEISERLSRSGADLVSLSEKIDTTSAAGRMIFNLLSVLSQFEREQIGERTSLAMRHMKSQGKRVGAIPFGFDLKSDGETLTENLAEQAVICEIRARRMAGASLRAIAAAMNSKGLKPKVSNRWHPSTVRNVLSQAPIAFKTRAVNSEHAVLT